MTDGREPSARERARPTRRCRSSSRELSARLARCPDLDTLVSTTLTGLAELFGYEHSLLMLLDETGERLYTIASHGYATEGIGSEVRVGEGIIGMAAARRRADAGREPRPDARVRADRAPRRTRNVAVRRPGARSRCPGWPTPRARLPCPRWCSASSSAWSRSRANGGSRSARPTRRCSPSSPRWSPSAIEIDWANERAERRARRRRRRHAAPGAAADPAAAPRVPRPVLRRRRQHVPRRRVPHQGGRRPDPVGAARPLRRATAAASSPTRRCGSTRRSSCPSSATTSRAGSSC